MDNKKIGLTLVILAVAVGTILWNTAGTLEERSIASECNPTQQCENIAATMGFTHIGMGVLGAIFALGIYLIFFNASEKEILKRLEAEKEKSLAKERLAIMLQALDENEKKILKAISEQNGITQKTLTIRTGLSKSKVSQVLSSFERKGIISRQAKGRTYSVHLKQAL